MPATLLKQAITDSTSFAQDISPDESLSRLNSMLDSELNQTSALIQRRLKVFSKAIKHQKLLYNKVQDPYSYVAISQNQLDDSLEQFEALVAVKKAAIAVEADLW